MPAKQQAAAAFIVVHACACSRQASRCCVVAAEKKRDVQKTSIILRVASKQQLKKSAQKLYRHVRYSLVQIVHNIDKVRRVGANKKELKRKQSR